MRILMVCPYFPPENAIAAVRLDKFAQHLAGYGDSLRVVSRTADGDGLEFPSGDIVAHRFPDPTIGVHARVNSAENRVGALDGVFGSRVSSSPIWDLLRKWGARAARLLAPWPDRFAPWAILSWRRIDLGDWRPDVILGSSGPFSSLILAAALARRYGVPWVADYRDLLASGNYYNHGGARRALDLLIERWVVCTSSAITTVSPSLATNLERIHRRPVSLVMNGFDLSDLPIEHANVYPLPGSLVLSYCGEIYPGRRDPRALFRAMFDLRRGGLDVRVRFYGASVGTLRRMAAEEGVFDLVDFHPRVSYRDSLKAQAESDVLLLLMWNDKREEGVLTGKLFEYFGARRPILMLGFSTGVAAELVRARGAGVVANQPREIAEALRGWALEKAERGAVRPVNLAAQSGLSRREQVACLRKVLEQVSYREIN